MINSMASETLKCICRTGKVIDVVIAISAPVTIQAEGGFSEYAQCTVSLEPLMRSHKISGLNNFQSLCLAMDYIRTVLKSFVADGGGVYWRNTNSPVNLDSTWFETMPYINSIR